MASVARPYWLHHVGGAQLGIILAGSLLPVAGPDLGVQMQDKWLHLLAYALTGGYFFALFTSRTRLVFIGLGAFGLAIELLQWMVPFRSAEWLDLAADLLGLLLGWLVVRPIAARLMDWLTSRAGAEQ